MAVNPDSTDPLAFERLLADLSATLINVAPDNTPVQIEMALGRLVTLLGFDRGAVTEVDAQGERMRVLASWARPGIPAFRSENAASDLPWLAERLRLGEVMMYTKLPESLPVEADAERRECEAVGVKSSLSIPIAVGGAFRGIVSFDAIRSSLELPETLVRRSRLIGEIFANTMVRAGTERQLRQALAEVRELKDRLEAENALLREEVKSSHDFEEIVGDSAALRRVLVQAEQVAPTDSSVLITGETGTGKELIARAIHNRSARRERAFVAVNCAALPATLIESELFGHEKGAFTGALSRKIGRFELSDGGTIFLDEIGELALDLQPKLLRVLELGEFERLGATRTMRVDVRVIAATNRDLPAATAQGRFRADLYYRLGVFPIHLPPLRERREDIPLLVWFFITRKQGKLGKHIERVPQEFMRRLTSYAWPGNVRELENVVERALIRSSGPALHVDDLGAKAEAAPPDGDGGQVLEAVERAHILAVLRDCGGRINGPGNAAERLGLKPSTLRFRIKKLHIERR
jgi:transcriptional regulator with GAF, ATPase, and Fis domain